MTDTTLAPDLLAVTLAKTLAQEHVADIVETLNEQDNPTVARILLDLPFERAVEVLDQPEFAETPEVLSLLPEARAAAFLQAMSADRAADVFEELEEPFRSGIGALIDRKTHSEMEQLSAYPEHSAGSIMTTEFVSVPSSWTVQQTLDHIRRVERSRETVYAIYVLDPLTHKLVRSASLRRLISADPAAPVASAGFEAPQSRESTSRSSQSLASMALGRGVLSLMARKARWQGSGTLAMPASPGARRAVSAASRRGWRHNLVRCAAAHPFPGRSRPYQAGSASRACHIALKAGRAWHASSQAFTCGAASKSCVAGLA